MSRVSVAENSVCGWQTCIQCSVVVLFQWFSRLWDYRVSQLQGQFELPLSVFASLMYIYFSEHFAACRVVTLTPKSVVSCTATKCCLHCTEMFCCRCKFLFYTLLSQLCQRECQYCQRWAKMAATLFYYAPAPVGEAGALSGHRRPSVRPSVWCRVHRL